MIAKRGGPSGAYIRANGPEGLSLHCSLRQTLARNVVSDQQYPKICAAYHGFLDGFVCHGRSSWLDTPGKRSVRRTVSFVTGLK
jgi:hypothetical protein